MLKFNSVHTIAPDVSMGELAVLKRQLKELIEDNLGVGTVMFTDNKLFQMPLKHEDDPRFVPPGFIFFHCYTEHCSDETMVLEGVKSLVQGKVERSLYSQNVI